MNPLRVPTQAYRFYRVNGHENKRNKHNGSVVTPYPVLQKGAYAHVLSVCVCRMSTTSHMFDTCRHLPKILLTPADTAMAGVSFRYAGDPPCAHVHAEPAPCATRRQAEPGAGSKVKGKKQDTCPVHMRYECLRGLQHGCSEVQICSTGPSERAWATCGYSWSLLGGLG